MLTRWGREVAPDNAWPQYPRPQMSRPEWTNLNGLWDYAIRGKDAADAPSAWDGQILVPYAVESALSGVGKLLETEQTLWYQRTFDYKPQQGRKLLLNFEAVDYAATVMVNGKQVGRHVGGNLPFSFDITSAVSPGENTLVVRVTDATGGYQLRGKQRLDPKGIWYTRVSGIHQSVWLEPVPDRHIESLKIDTHASKGEIAVTAKTGDDKCRVEVTAMLDGKAVATAVGEGRVILPIPDAKPWSPNSPTLYDLKVKLLDAEGQALDEVSSYAGIRTLGKERDADGNLRFTLNGEPIFHWGPLDQGWWPDGLLTPPSDEATRWEIGWLKKAGFNMIRKHIKVEPRRYYHHCDKLGMLVWQDQVSAMPDPKSPAWTRMAPNPEDADWPAEAHQQYMTELQQMVDTLGNSPAIAVWVPFNEAWGQHNTIEVGEWLSKHDPSRPVNVASGGNFWPVGQVADHHNYPSPDFPLADPRFEDYIKVVGEFGGHGWPVKGHLWKEDSRNWGYGGLPKSLQEYRQRYRKTLGELAELKKKGIAAGVYTQTTDVEGEINGLMTYDREEVKIPAGRLKKIHSVLWE
ncbi:Beta-galactosidase [Pirellulimonas nuda]|uniref:Beta-galactosidase n=2 Tax=Pirellulimonas nuda TaxID=2528009 RepID=A0A518D9Z5_9BACT|nr:Beta-galactosidase [Pirellulimonas nuda]